MNNFEDPKIEEEVKIPTHKVAFYAKDGRLIDVKEVESLVPSMTLMANAEKRYPDLFEQADSVQPVDPNILKK